MSQLDATTRARAARPGRRGRLAPPQLTGGEKTAEVREPVSGRAKVDWWSMTWLPESSDIHVARELWDLLTVWLGGGVVGRECPGRYGYEFGCTFGVVVHGSVVNVGRVDWGGERMGHRARVDLSGAGCSRVTDWAPIRAWIERQEAAKLTRVDLAVDCLMGEYSVDDAVTWYESGIFRASAQGTQPRHSTVGDWLGDGPQWGRTLEVGRRENGKMCRVYEKGRQLGDAASPWVRWEVELRNNDRDLPFDILTDCDRYFVGAYQCLEALLPVAGERIATHQAEGEIQLGQLVTFSRSSYGQLVQVLRGKLDASQVLDLITRPGVPRRLHRASLVAFETLGAAALSDRQEFMR